MKNNTKKNILQKMIFALLLIMIVFNFISPQIVLADDDSEADNGILRIIIKRDNAVICIIRRCNNGSIK